MYDKLAETGRLYAGARCVECVYENIIIYTALNLKPERVFDSCAYGTALYRDYATMSPLLF